MNRRADPKTLAIRSLNCAHKIHLPTYVGARYLVESIVPDPQSSFAYSSTTLKYAKSTPPRFLPTKRFKKHEGGTTECRDFYIPSPWTCLAEAAVLDGLSRSPAFQKDSFVYSYRWPSHGNSFYNFEHYFGAYSQRTMDIRERIRRAPASVAVVADIKQFYPSVVQSTVRACFLSRLAEAGLPAETHAVASALLDHILGGCAGGRGIPIGPEISHVLGDLALADADTKLEGLYPGHYFRYVDDLVVVVPRQDADQCRRELENVLDKENLVLNKDKSDEVTCEDWIAHAPGIASRITEFTFGAMVFRFKLYMARRPDKAEDLRAALISEGLRIPLSRMRWSAARSAFHARMKAFWRGQWRVLIDAVSDDISGLVRYAARVREGLLKQFDELMQLDVPQTPMLRKWHLQRVRYVVNRLLYLLPESDLRRLRDCTCGFDECAESTAVLNMMVDGDLVGLLATPGPAVDAYASLMRDSGKASCGIEIASIPDESALHSAATLLLSGLARVSAAGRAGLSPPMREYFSFCDGSTPSARVLDDFSYLDELRCLQIQRKPEDRLHMLDERYSDDESSVFDALRLGDTSPSQ